MRKSVAAVVAFLFLTGLLSSPGEAGVKILARVTGTVASRSDAEKGWKPVFTTREVVSSDWAKTRSLSMAKVFLEDRKSFLKIYENTEVQIKEVQTPGEARKLEVDQNSGRIRATIRRFLGEKQKVQIKTPTAVLAIEGTVAGSLIFPDLTTIFGIYSGWGRVFAGGQPLTLGPGDSAVIYPGGQPILLPHGASMVADASGNLHEYEDSPSDEATGNDIPSDNLLPDHLAVAEQQYDNPHKEASLGGGEYPAVSFFDVFYDSGLLTGTGTGSSSTPASGSPLPPVVEIQLSGTFGSSLTLENSSSGLSIYSGPAAGTGILVGNDPASQLIPSPPSPAAGIFGGSFGEVFDLTAFDLVLGSPLSPLFSGTILSGQIWGVGTWSYPGGGPGSVTFDFAPGNSLWVIADGTGFISPGSLAGTSISLNKPALNATGGGSFTGTVDTGPPGFFGGGFKILSVQSH